MWVKAGPLRKKNFLKPEKKYSEKNMIPKLEGGLGGRATKKRTFFAVLAALKKIRMDRINGLFYLR